MVTKMFSTRMRCLVNLSASAVMITAATVALGQASSASESDRKFVEDALKGGMAEIQLGQMAAEKGASDDVRKFGAMMVTDHTKLGDDMKVVAGDIGVAPPTDINAMDSALKMRLEHASGADFDKLYIQAMVKDHQQDLKDFRKEATSGQSTEVKTAAQKGSMVVSHHLDMIKQIAQAHNVSASSGE